MTNTIRFWKDHDQTLCPKCARADHPTLDLPNEGDEGLEIDHLTAITDPKGECSECLQVYQVCDDCGEVIGENDPITVGNLDETILCEGCGDSDLEHGGNMGRYMEGEPHERVHFGIHVANLILDGDYQEELPGWWNERFIKRSWHRTDPWRGYYETEWKGLHAIAAGWLTGTPDILRSGKLPPVPLYWYFDTTSNLFSQVSELLVDEGNQDKMIEWLKSVGLDIDELAADF
jgi:hypothetical protein